MNRKDRIAIAISVIYFLVTLVIITNGDDNTSRAFIVFSLTIVLYWAYRFIKNDISFLKVKDVD